ncbi:MULTISPECIES: nucleotide exchange factor GrpE [unclassified Methanoregula]|uniref:nucleotide exchange factor GrpE n=1 Tax=unclassified Methanoregula TaxID=2649730 RepID=UPI0009CE50E1|nr:MULTISPECIES: nucleotide exchange factor GrpE [unclassified Methanoregula]OPX62675.1 MAG: heat shock protein GrpE [Methanoregula sp. PtaB.Bin085]OPY37250.1 MAG: heat shock protein GrpE [Methanoregula sp. PtaU1.Bin006]
MNDAERSPDQVMDKAPAPSVNPVPEPFPPPEPEEQKKAYDELNDRFLRLAADFENFRRRTAKERESIVALANERFAVDLLEVMDNFERALKSDDSHLREGLEQIRQLMSAQLQRHGIIPIDSLKKAFNPAEHDAIAHVPSREPEGTVIDEVSRGYRMNDRVIRHAKVAVSKGNQD